MDSLKMKWAQSRTQKYAQMSKMDNQQKES